MLASLVVLIVLALAAVLFAGNVTRVVAAVKKSRVAVARAAPRKPAAARKPPTMYTTHAYRSVASGPLTGLERVKTYSPAMVAGHRFA
jgi:hypothetical protein